MNAHTALAEPLLSFVVRGQPAAQGSKRGYVVNGHVNVVEDGKRTRPWRDTVKNAAVDAMERKPGCFPITGPVALHATFYLARPKGHYRTGRNAHLLRDSAPTRPTTKPDGDKMLRLVCDSLKDAGAYRDDAQVVDFSAHKRYADASHLPGVVILLRPLEVASC